MTKNKDKEKKLIKLNRHNTKTNPQFEDSQPSEGDLRAAA